MISLLHTGGCPLKSSQPVCSPALHSWHASSVWPVMHFNQAFCYSVCCLPFSLSQCSVVKVCDPSKWPSSMRLTRTFAGHVVSIIGLAVLSHVATPVLFSLNLCLYMQVPSFDNKVAMTMIQQELGRPWQDVYSQLTPRPIAAASLGQVRLNSCNMVFTDQRVLGGVGSLHALKGCSAIVQIRKLGRVMSYHSGITVSAMTSCLHPVSHNTQPTIMSWYIKLYCLLLFILNVKVITAEGMSYLLSCLAPHHASSAHKGGISYRPLHVTQVPDWPSLGFLCSTKLPNKDFAQKRM